MNPGEPGHRHDIDLLTSRLIAPREPGFEHLLHRPPTTSRSRDGPGAGLDRGEVGDDGDLLVAAAGVPLDVLIDPDDL